MNRQARGAHGFIAGTGVLVGEGQGGCCTDALACARTGQGAHGGLACGTGGAVVGLADLGGADGEVGFANDHRAVDKTQVVVGI